MPNNKLNDTSLRIAQQLANDLKSFIPENDGQTDIIQVHILQMAVSSGVNIAIHAFKQVLTVNVQEKLIKAYLRKNVKGYK